VASTEFLRQQAGSRQWVGSPKYPTEGTHTEPVHRFEDINRKMDDWLTKLDDVIEQDSVGKNADELLEEEFLSLE